MKLIIFFLPTFFICVTETTYAQVAARDGFEIVFPVTSLTLMKGTTDSVGISIIRSKGFRKGDAEFTLSSPKSKGIDVTIQPINNKSDSFTLSVSVDEIAMSGEYIIIPSCTIQNKIKGTVFKVIVN